MKKIFIVLVIILSLIIFFYPKNKFFGCGGIVCLKEEYDKTKQEEENVFCLGFKKEPSVTYTETDAKGCYGIFINKNYF